MIIRNIFFKLFFIVIIANVVFQSLELRASPNAITFQSKIIKPDGSPLESAAVSFRLSVTDSVGTCVIYQEDFVNRDMSASKGLINLSIGSGVKAFPVGVFTLPEVFNNFNSPTLNCQAGGTINPGPNDRRKLVMQFNDGGGWQTAPAMDINSTPFSIQAMSSQKLGDYPAADYLRTVTLPTCAGGEALHFNGTSITCIVVGGGSGTVTSVTSANTDIAVATTTTTPVLTLNVGTGNNQIVKLNGSAQLPAVSGANLTSLNASNLASGTIPAAQMPAITGDVTTVAGAVSSTISANAVTSAKILDDEIVNVDIKSNAAIARSKLASGSNDHVLINNGAGSMTSEAQLAVTRGGTGLSSYTANALLMANGTGTALVSATCSSAGEVLSWTGASAWACTDMSSAGLGFYKNGGNTVTGTATIGTNSNHNLEIETNNITRVTIDNSGNVGIGAASSGSKLEVAGNITQTSGQTVNVPYDNGAAVAFNFNNGNVQYTTADCQAMTLTNMQNGGVYTIIVRGTVSGTCGFTHGADSFYFVPGIAATVAGTRTIFSFMKVGSEIYVNWTSGYE